MRDMRTILALFLVLSIGISGIIVPATAATDKKTLDGDRPVYAVDIPVPQETLVFVGNEWTTRESDKEGSVVILPSWN